MFFILFYTADLYRINYLCSLDLKSAFIITKKPQLSFDLYLMEDQINAAEKSTSISAEICQWSGAVFGILFGLGFFLAEVQKNDLKSLPWWKPISALVAGAAVSAHGNNVANNKRTAELTALLVRSTNSASELPIAKSSEYSDLLEDSDNQ